MPFTTVRRVTALTLLALTAGSALGQAEAPRQLLLIEHRGLASMVNDPRDAGLKKAVEMIPARLAELREEIPGMPPEAVTLMDMVPRMIARPAHMAIAYTAGEPTGGLFNYGIVVSIEAADEAEANRNHERIKGLLRASQAPTSASKRLEGFTEIELGPPGNLAYGVRKSASGWRNEVVYGTVGDLDKMLEAPASMIKGGRTIMSASLDLSALTPAEKMVLTVAPKDTPQIREMAAQFRKMGLVGDGAMKIRTEAADTEVDSVSMTRVENAGKFKGALHMTSEPLTEADLRAIPADATVASIARGDLGYMRDALDQAAKQTPDVNEMLGNFKEMTGVDIRTDLIDCIGGSFGFYMSDSTGGGGLGSSVVLIGLQDRERFMKAHAKLLAKARELMEQNLNEMPGPYLKLDSWKEGGVDMTSLRMRGLPMPVELTYAATAKWLVLGLTPQAVTAAARQCEGKGDGGIMTNPRVAELVKSRSSQLTALKYSDTPRMVRQGYTLLAMLGNGLANGVRSPVDPAREPGLVVPPPHDLLKNARSAVSISYWDGDTMVMEGRQDRSLLVNAGGMVGFMTELAPIFGGIAAAAMSAGREGMGPFGMDIPLVPGVNGPAARMMAVLEPWWVSPLAPARLAVLADDLRPCASWRRSAEGGRARYACPVSDPAQPVIPVVHQTGRFVVIDKPAGFRSVQGLGPDGQRCAVNAVRAMFPGATGPVSVHRLDMATSGLLLLALDADTHRRLSAQFEARTVAKRYVAVLGGPLGLGSAGEVSLPLRPDYDRRPVQIVDFVHGKPALTRWRTLGTDGATTRVEFEPVTGRSHQLRLHAAYRAEPAPGGLGRPIVGDTLYGGVEAPRLMLHAAELEFDDPETGARVRVTSMPPF